MDCKKGCIVIIVGPSGVGKTTICKSIISKLDNFHFSVSCTTRLPRKNEANEREYYFINSSDFKNYIYKNQFIEHIESLTGDFYGTLKSEIIDKINSGINVLMEIEIKGTVNIHKLLDNDYNIKTIFILPDNIDELKKRLINRRTEENIDIRLKIAESEIDFIQRYLKNAKLKNKLHVLYNTHQKVRDVADKVLDIIGENSKK